MGGALQPGQIVGRYRVESLVGRGGMGEVYRAWDAELERPVALKVMRDDLEEDEESKVEASSRFAREARMAARIVSPHFGAIFEVFEHGDTTTPVPVLVMEWIEGSTLRSRIHDASLGVRERIEWALVLARGLAEAHAKGIVHRDFKPGNVLVASKDGALKIVDFGLAKRVKTKAATTLSNETSNFETKTGMVLGTERYMAPEQAAGASIDERVDQFAWGVVAYELLSRMHPQNTTRDGSFPTSPPPSLDSIVADIPAHVAASVQRALALLPSDRFASMNDLVRALETPAVATKRMVIPPTPQTAGKQTAGKKTFAISVGITLVVTTALLVAGLGWSSSSRRKSPSAPISHATPSSVPSASVASISSEAAPESAPPENAPEVASATPSSSIALSPNAKAPPKSKWVSSGRLDNDAWGQGSASGPSISAHNDDSALNTPLRTDGSADPSPEEKKRQADLQARSGLTPGTRPFRFRMSSYDSGPYDPAHLMSFINAKKPNVDGCFSRPDFDGSDAQTIVRLVSGAEGKVTSVAVEHGKLAPNFRSCIEATFRALALPAVDRREVKIRFYINVER